MDGKQFEILGVKVQDLSASSLDAILRSYIAGGEPRVVVTPNPEFILSALNDQDFRQVLGRADLSLPDGVGLKFAVAALFDDTRLEYRHTGLETFKLLARLAGEEKVRMLILGGTGKDPEVVAEMFRGEASNLDIVAYDPGIIDDDLPRLNEATVAKLKAMEPAIIAVALGQGRGRAQGKQEKVIEFLRRELPTARVLIGVGGSVHMLANPHLLAPESWRKRGFEWLWRLIKQPWRSSRIIRATALFPLEVAWDTLSKRRFWRAVRNVLTEFK